MFKCEDQRVTISHNRKHVAKYQIKQAVEAVDRIVESSIREE